MQCVNQLAFFAIWSLCWWSSGYVFRVARAECCTEKYYCGDWEQAFCADCTMLDNGQDFCCGIGKCNIMCCNCDGGCRPDKQGVCNSGANWDDGTCRIREGAGRSSGLNGLPRNQSSLLAFSPVARFLDNPKYVMSRDEFLQWVGQVYPGVDGDAEFATLDLNQDSKLTVEEVDRDLANGIFP